MGDEHMTSTPKVGVMGLGKLGLPFALVLDAVAKCQVTGYDPDPRPADILIGRAPAPTEPAVAGFLKSHQITMASDPDMLVRLADTIFVVVPTPHPGAFAGDRPLSGDVSSFPGEITEFDSPDGPVDFEYGYLIQAVRSLSRAAWQMNKKITVAIVSTVLPGTITREIKPVTGEEVTLVYTPSLIALGSVVHDLQNPEFVIVGVDRHEDAVPVCEVISKIHGEPFQIMDIESAELTKIAYNTYTSMKIVFGNTIMELAHKTGADCDKVTEALSLATTNLMSGRYLKGGMGGGGYCHPRDLVAASWLARKLGVQTDVFTFLSRSRESQSAWLAGLAEHWSKLTGLPIVLLGEAYKPASDLTGGSAARLLANQLAMRSLYAEVIDPHTQSLTNDDLRERMDKPAVYVISTDHMIWKVIEIPAGSVVIDPSGKIPDQPSVTVVRIGRKS
jgi:UDPglucose 6-dehydrogenase